MKSLKKNILTFSALVLLASTVNAVPTRADDNPTGFADMRDHWAKKAVATAITKKYVDGYGDGSFRPENYVSTAEFIKMVVTATQLPVIGSTDGREWYVPYVKAAVEKGIVREDSINTDIINKPISRIEMSKIAVRATDPTLQQKYVSINDQGAMYTAASKGLIQGLANGELAPDGSTTRAQSVTIIERILSLNSGGKLETDKLAISNAELAFRRTNLFSMIPIFAGTKGESSEWTPDKLVLETADGKFKGEIDQVVVIDMANPNDPNRGLLGDINDLHWFAPGREGEMPLVKDYPDSYVILVKSHVDYVKDTAAYAENGKVGLSIYGFKSPDPTALAKGELNTLATVFKNRRGDMQCMILPKSGFETAEYISIKLNAPARPPVDDSTRTITSVWVPSGK
ncbi:S-layer homology domain-containing protein [Paenibacillus alginolyticus]|uniref:S-layer homology domain-containing protein n=1 Tax=Paenibacillus alginolyticus TaxID=59839 RepID=UPI000687AACC|nr:S-layer homology domain-containing protein [Paenibacillus alginolyticus]MCY9665869.1 S-layer homology domain-containing protein [Paenibacillus alginolyticus]